MQFKHPELLWGLLLLLIPIIVHLFQLRRFKKTPFTNVKFLKKVVSESRRSNTLKKWLLLLSRILLLAALVIAFAQPFFADKTALKTKEMVIYLDDSFSMQAKKDNTTLLDDAIQNLIQSIPQDQKFSLFTNTKVFKEVSIKNLQNDLLLLRPSAAQLKLSEIALKGNTLFSSNENTLKNLIIVSDFQERMEMQPLDSLFRTTTHLVLTRSDIVENISIDSVYMNPTSSENIEVVALISASYDLESTPISLFNENELIAKTAVTFDKNRRAKVNFTLPSDKAIQGRIELLDGALSYDNQLYFNIDSKEKIKILVIGETQSDYLKRIFTADEFEVKVSTLNNLNYGELNNQNLIVLNELNSIPNPLTISLKSFVGDNGNVIVIPAKEIDITSYNQFLFNYYGTSYAESINADRNISGINFSHPLYRNVFEKKVVNFQYPKVFQYFKTKSKAPSILSYQDKNPFVLGVDKVYVFTAAISAENSNFKSSPLIVPTLYNMGINSLKLPQLYQNLGSRIEIELPVQLPKDHILKVVKDELEFIPEQKSFANKVSILFRENPSKDGIFKIMNKETVLKNLSFNFSRHESDLKYLDFNTISASTKNESIQTLFEDLENDDAINELWKWFIILAAAFMLAEVLIQKYL
jgi:hypothetical protein